MPDSEPPTPPSQSYLEQTASLLSTVATYMRLPALASTVRFASCLSEQTSPAPSSRLVMLFSVATHYRALTSSASAKRFSHVPLTIWAYRDHK